MHHSDADFDLSTGFRFHPVESILNLAIFLLVVAAFGIVVEAIVIRGVLIYFINFFTHANANLHPSLDRSLRILFVTPSMHRIHHSRNIDDSNMNFGALLSGWDRLFGTYRKQSVIGEGPISVGLETMPDSHRLNLWELLLMPFKVQEPSKLDVIEK